MNIDRAMLIPESEFENPDDVVNDQRLTRKQKISILRRWEYDARELQVAEEENMTGGPVNNVLDDVLKALGQLDVEKHDDDAVPTKHGGT